MMAETEITSLRIEAASGHPDALFRLAGMLVVAGQTDEACALHRRAAETGHARARIEYARMSLYGIGTIADPGSAVQWLLAAEADGEAIASYYLALIAVGGNALPFDERANARLLAAVNAGYPPALRAAAIHFGRKRNESDQALCVRLLDQAAQAGDTVAALLLAERIALGEGCVADAQAASEVHAQLAAHGVAPLPRISLAAPLRSASAPRTLTLQDAGDVPAPRMLSQSPRIGVVEQLLSADECRLLMATSSPRLRQSQTVDPATGLPVQIELRTSSDASHDPLSEDLSLRLLQLRMARTAGTPLLNAEHLTVLRYAPGQEYRPHRDYVSPGALERDTPQAGNRARTICAYLNHVQAGGETEFPLAGIRVLPSPGSAVVFDNLDEHGQPDPSSLHAGLPVERGEKWLATLWLRQHRYRSF